MKLFFETLPISNFFWQLFYKSSQSSAHIFALHLFFHFTLKTSNNRSSIIQQRSILLTCTKLHVHSLKTVHIFSFFLKITSQKVSNAFVLKCFLNARKIFPFLLLNDAITCVIYLNHPFNSHGHFLNHPQSFINLLLFLSFSLHFSISHDRFVV